MSETAVESRSFVPIRPSRPLVAALCLVLAQAAKPASAQTAGCTDTLAQNFDPDARTNDGSCAYAPFSIGASRTVTLPELLVESSGLSWHEGQLFTVNDSGDPRLYRLDTLTGEVLSARRLTAENQLDWEALYISGDTLYVGDFGNNASGNRRDLRILRLYLGGDTSQLPRVDTIGFAYADQTDFSPQPANATDFDCEAFVVRGDSIFLFTKGWTSRSSVSYALPNRPGAHVAQPRDTLDAQGLITDATYRSEDGLVVLTGYTPTLQPFLFLLYDFEEGRYFSGNKRRIEVELPFHQVEGVATPDGRRYFVSNELFRRSFLRVPQALHVFDLDSLIGPYLDRTTSVTEGLSPKHGLRVHPNPSGGRVTVEGIDGVGVLRLYGSAGELLEEWRRPEPSGTLDLRAYPAGVYFLRADAGPLAKVVRE